MGTLSRYKGASPRSTKANRKLTGQSLGDCMVVINSPKKFNRATRMVVYSMWRKYARSLRIKPHELVQRLKGTVVPTDTVANVQCRVLMRAGLI